MTVNALKFLFRSIKFIDACTKVIVNTTHYEATLLTEVARRMISKSLEFYVQSLISH